MIWAVSLTQTLQLETSLQNQTSHSFISLSCCRTTTRAANHPYPQKNTAGDVHGRLKTAFPNLCRLLPDWKWTQKGIVRRMQLWWDRKYVTKNKTMLAGKTEKNVFLWKFSKQKNCSPYFYSFGWRNSWAKWQKSTHWKTLTWLLQKFSSDTKDDAVWPFTVTCYCPIN